jgi:hypothetical protein
MKRFIAYLLFSCLFAGVSWGQALPWSAAFEADPAVNDPVSEGDDRIREMKENIRYRDEVEHWYGPTGAVGDNGVHRDGSGKCFMGTAFPTILSDGMSDFESGGGPGEADLDDPASNSAAGDRDDVGDGRCFIDIDGPDNVADTDDDYTLYIYEGAAGAAGCPAPAGADDCWHAVVADSPYEASDDEILAGKYNLVYNGSFEATDGGGDPASTVVPEGWAVVVGDTPGYTYVNASTDVRYGDGYHLVLANTEAANEGMRQTVTNLNANSTYKLIARVQDDGPVGAVVCRMDIVNETATTDFPADSTNPAVAAWETIGGTFTTGVVVTTVDIEIYPIGIAGESCMLDHFTMFEVGNVGTDRDEISEPGAIVLRGEYLLAGGDLTCGLAYGAGPCAVGGSGLFVTVTAPTIGRPLIILDGLVTAVAAGAAPSDCEVRLRNITNTTTLEEFFTGGTYNLHRTILGPPPGATTVYGIEVRENPGGGGTCSIASTHDSWIEAVVLPTR